MSAKYSETIKAHIKVAKAPPKNPSNVLLGESLIRGVLPKAFPKKKAKLSLIITATVVNMYQNIP